MKIKKDKMKVKRSIKDLTKRVEALEKANSPTSVVPPPEASKV